MLRDLGLSEKQAEQFMEKCGEKNEVIQGLSGI
jgi:hypothetical protein